MQPDSKSIKYTITYENNEGCGLAVIEAEIDDSNPSRITLPLYHRNNPDEINTNTSLQKYKVHSNTDSKPYEIIGIQEHKTAGSYCLIVREL